MLPAPLTLGPLSLNFYGLLVTCGALAALALFSLTAPRRAMSPAASRDFCFWMILAGLLGSRLFYVIFHWPEFSGRPLTILAYWRGGLMFQGGVLTALAVSPLFLKRYGLSFWPAADVMAPSLALGQGLGRLGCFTAGCCYGRPASLANPLGVTFPPGSLAPFGLPLWPTQLLESAGLLALALILGLALGRSQGAFSRTGRVAALYLAGAGLLRLLMESLRGDYRGAPVIWHLPPTTLAAALAAILGLGLIWSRRPIKN